MARGNHETKYYICADMDCDSNVRPPELPGCIVEIHGSVGPGRANVGIYTDDLGRVPDDARIRMIFFHIGDAYFERIS